MKVADIGNLRDHYLMVAMLRLRTAAIKQPDKMNRRAPTYFTRRFKSAETVALFNKSVEEHIHNFKSHSQPNLNWDAVKMLSLCLNHVVSSEVPPFAPTTETILPAKSIP